jgi:uncharacterized lipoprotein YajG
MLTRQLALVAIVVGVWLLSGCAATRSTFDVPAVQAQASTPKGLVQITDVRDIRRFEAAPRNPSTPSLQNPEELKDRAITSRAIARKRGGYGNAMADILLPDGRTVGQIVREAITQALREQGYAVVADGQSPELDKALPLQVEIEQFWAWFTPGLMQISVEFQGVLVLKSEALTGRKEEIVRGYAIVKGMAATDAEWREVVQSGVADLVKNVKAVVKAAE